MPGQQKKPSSPDESFSCISLIYRLLFEEIIHFLVGYNFLLERVSTGFRRFHHFNHLCKTFPGPFLQRRYGFLCHGITYLISLWTVTFFRMGLYFFNSIRPVVFFRFLVVTYRDIPGIPLSLCSMHSRITWTLLPFFAIVYFF